MKLTKKLKLILRAINKIDNWTDYILDYLGFKSGYITYTINDTKLMVRANTVDKSILTEILLEGSYFPKWLKLAEDSVVIDIGAHIGIFSALVSKRVSKGKVYSIEPCKDNFDILCKQKELGNGNIIPFNLAISDTEGRLRLNHGRNSARGSLVRDVNEDYEYVDTISLNKFFAYQNITKCDLMKIDIEGGEYAALYSLEDNNFDKITNIFMELHEVPNESKEDLIKFLEGKGFKIHNQRDILIYATKQ